MLYQVIGINRHRVWNYQDRSGVNQLIYLRNCQPLKGDNVEGYACEMIKAPASFDSSGLMVGKTYDFYFNRYGNVEGYELVEDKK